MARLPRLNLPDIPQHVVQRGNNRQVCFFAEQDYCVYLQINNSDLIDFKALDFNTGRGFIRGNPDAQQSNSVRVIIDRDDLSINGFRVHTAFPTLNQ